MSAARILFLDQTGELGGAELSLLDLASHVCDRCEVVLFADGPFVRLLRERGVKVTVLAAGKAFRSVGREKAWPGLAVTCELGKQVLRVARMSRTFDVIHCNTQKAFVAGALAGWLARRPVIYHLRDMLTADHFSSFNRRVAVGLANRFAAKVLANSKATYEAFIQAGGNPQRVEVLYNGIDPQPIQEAKPVPDLRELLGVGAAPLFGLFSRLSPWKGQHVLVEALAQVPEAQVILVGESLFGEDDYATRLHQQVEQLGLEKRVHFLGFRQDVAALLKSIDGLVHASTVPEPFGRVIVEGMLAGKPVVATAAGGALEIVKDGVTGRLVEPGSPDALAAVLKSWCNSPETRAQLGRVAQVEALERFALADKLKRFEAIVQEASKLL